MHIIIDLFIKENLIKLHIYLTVIFVNVETLYISFVNFCVEISPQALLILSLFRLFNPVLIRCNSVLSVRSRIEDKTVLRAKRSDREKGCGENRS